MSGGWHDIPVLAPVPASPVPPSTEAASSTSASTAPASPAPRFTVTHRCPGGQSRDSTHWPTQYPCAHTRGDLQSLARRHRAVGGAFVELQPRVPTTLAAVRTPRTRKPNFIRAIPLPGPNLSPTHITLPVHEGGSKPVPPSRLDGGCR